MPGPHTVESVNKAISAAISACPESAPLRKSLNALRAPLCNFNDVCELDVSSWQPTLAELSNFAEDVVALLGTCEQSDPESRKRLEELHASAVNHELELDGRGLLTAFQPSHAHAAHLAVLSSCVDTPPRLLQRVFHSLPTLFRCVETLINLPLSSHAISQAIISTLADSEQPPEAANAPAARLDPPRYQSLTAAVEKYIASCQPGETTNPDKQRVVTFLQTLLDPWTLKDELIRLQLPTNPFHLPFEIGRSSFATVYKAVTSVRTCAGQRLWITNAALKAYVLPSGHHDKHDSFKLEVLRLRTFSHPCLPAFYGYHWPFMHQTSGPCVPIRSPRPSDKALLATELMTTNLYKARKSLALRTMEARLLVLRDVADAIAYLHKHGVSHGRINPNNVLLRISGDTVYGRSKLDVTSIVGRVIIPRTIDDTPLSALLYCAPVGTSESREPFSVDIWSFGVVACFLLLERDSYPPLNMTRGALLRLICSPSLTNQLQSWSGAIPDRNVRSIVTRCFVDDPGQVYDGQSLLNAFSDVVRDVFLSPEATGAYIEEAVNGTVVDEVIDSGGEINASVRSEPKLNTKRRLPPPQNSPKRFRLDSARRESGSLPVVSTQQQTTGAGTPAQNRSAGAHEIHVDSPPPSQKRASAGFSQTVTPEIIDDSSDEGCDPNYKFSLAENLERGIGVDQDLPRAVKLYEEASRAGHLHATYNLGRLYQCGSGVNKSLKTAVYLFQKAAEGGLPGAMVALGRLHETGSGVKESLSQSVRYYRQAADKGSSEGLRCLGECHLNGLGVRKDVSKAVNLLLKAQSGGDVPAGALLGFCYLEGIGTQQDVKKASHFCGWSAERGHAEAQRLFADCFLEGLGVERDAVKAFDWYRRAAEQSNAVALTKVGECYLGGHGVQKDIGKAVEFFKKAAEAGNGCAMASLATCFESGNGVPQDMKMAVKLYKKAERQDDYLALNNLGVLYERGIHVAKDCARAVRYYRRAKEQGFLEAACNLADCYVKGNGVPRDIDKAIDLYTEAAEEGSASAQCELGSFYYSGTGVPKDYDRAIALFREACDVESEAVRLLGMAHYAGNGVSKNVSEAVRLFSQAADAGNADASMNLGMCYDEGSGVERDLSKALTLYQKAASEGSKEAKLLLGNMYFEGRGVKRNLEEAVKLFLEGEGVELT